MASRGKLVSEMRDEMGSGGDEADGVYICGCGEAGIV